MLLPHTSVGLQESVFRRWVRSIYAQSAARTSDSHAHKLFPLSATTGSYKNIIIDDSNEKNLIHEGRQKVTKNLALNKTNKHR